MTAAVNCQQFEEQAVELALGGVDEPRRAELARHAATCPSCHVRLEELSWLGERLLLLAPEIEPPPGFESRVLERLAAPGASGAGAERAGWARSAAQAGTVRAAAEPSEGSARRPVRRRLLATAVAAALAGALAALSVVAVTDRWARSGGDDDRTMTASPVTVEQGALDRVATLVRADGTVSGTAVLAAGPRPHLLVTIDNPRPRATALLCELIGADGVPVLVGSWTFADVERGAWAVGIAPQLLDAARMDVKDENGTVLSSAVFGR
jgi:hypothetical protein